MTKTFSVIVCKTTELMQPNLEIQHCRLKAESSALCLQFTAIKERKCLFERES